ncbi:MAG TPA: hypothetical protein VJ598_07235 [Albitalea sp.]|nr:hypothetical protein [Albitalea sp.]
MTPLFGQRQRLRRFALHMLLVWLFALGSGVVNACVLEPEARHDAAAAHVQAGMPSPQHDEDARHGTSAPCAKFCDDPAAAVQFLKQQTDVSMTLVALPTSALLPLIAEARVADAAAIERTPRSAAVPIQIAFLRLAL